MKSREDINAALRSNQVQMILSARRHEAAKQLFDAACFAGEGVEAQRQRDLVHSTMDELLDLSATAMTLTRQLMELPG